MKSAKEILIRAVLLVSFSDRCFLENEYLNGRKYSVQDREIQRKNILRWLSDKGYYHFATEEEKEIFELPIKEKPVTNILAKGSQYQAVESLLWTMNLVEEMTSYKNFVLTDFHPILKIKGDHSLPEYLSNIQLRNEEEVKCQREISMLWHWRMIELAHTKFFKKNVSEIIVNIFGENYKKPLSFIQFSKGNKNDFVFRNLKITELNKREKDALASLTYWRHYSFEWLISKDAWDEIEITT